MLLFIVNIKSTLWNKCLWYRRKYDKNMCLFNNKKKNCAYMLCNFQFLSCADRENFPKEKCVCRGMGGGVWGIFETILLYKFYKFSFSMRNQDPHPLDPHMSFLKLSETNNYKVNSVNRRRNCWMVYDTDTG